MVIYYKEIKRNFTEDRQSLACHPQKVKIMKVKERLRNCSRLNKTRDMNEIKLMMLTKLGLSTIQNVF